MLGALGAASWVVAADRLSAPDAAQLRPRATVSPDMKISIQPPGSPARQGIQPNAATALTEKPPIARLQESDVIRTLGGILTTGGTPDVTRLGWPTLHAGFPLTTFLNAMREMRAIAARRSSAGTMTVIAVIGAGANEDRSIVALNIALAAARDGSKVLLIDADHVTHSLSDKIGSLGKREPNRLGWLSIGSKASRVVKTVNGIAILPAAKGSDAKTSEAKASDSIGKAISQARSVGGHDLVILDGPALPYGGADRKLIDIADGLVAMLPADLDINDCMEDVITALGGAERKLVGVLLSELQPAAVKRQRDKRYA
jgi:Mrp family chromosome partitioning ATPase